MPSRKYPELLYSQRAPGAKRIGVFATYDSSVSGGSASAMRARHGADAVYDGMPDVWLRSCRTVTRPHCGYCGR
jgi:hypothetical protein